HDPDRSSVLEYVPAGAMNPAVDANVHFREARASWAFPAPRARKRPLRKDSKKVHIRCCGTPPAKAWAPNTFTQGS
ncbi:hypothetical protein, partial [Symbiobacterium thermophilum]|uniref:hypothetical protein n=1 Tax=Symbiobacterium thermophilum TaxID=2734 RepID=UPI0035C6EAD3